jgi:hypothetical protein
MSSLRTQLDAAQNENANLREAKKGWDQQKRKFVEIETELRHNNRILHDQLERVRRDME